MSDSQRHYAVYLVLGAGALGLLVCLLLPAVNGGGVSRRTMCRDNLHNIGIGLHNYHDVHDSFPPAYGADDRGSPIHSWRTYALPYVNQAPLYNEYDFDEPWNGPSNAALAESVGSLAIYQCVADVEERAVEWPWTSYVAVIGRNTGWPADRPARISDFSDGTANTCLLVETHNSSIHWMEPRDLHVTQMAPTVNSAAGQGISSPHEGGAFVLLGDGAVKWIADDVAPDTLRRLIERDDGEKIPVF